MRGESEHKRDLGTMQQARLTERHVHELAVGNDGDPTVEERVQHKLAMHVLVAAGTQFSAALWAQT